MKKVIGMAALFLLAISTQSHGFNSCYCGSALIRVGDTKATVLAKCGKPDLVDQEGSASAGTSQSQGSLTLKKNPQSSWTGQTREETATQGVTKTLEKWTYNRGPSQFIKILTFVGSELVSIEDGDYGW